MGMDLAASFTLQQDVCQNCALSVGQSSHYDRLLCWPHARTPDPSLSDVVSLFSSKIHGIRFFTGASTEKHRCHEIIVLATCSYTRSVTPPRCRYEPGTAINTTQSLIDDATILGLVGATGTPTAAAVFDNSANPNLEHNILCSYIQYMQ
jgi:hypothetical protein